MWLKELYRDMQQIITPQFMCENNMHVKISKDNTANKRTRHSDRKFFYVNEQLNKKSLYIKWRMISSLKMFLDLWLWISCVSFVSIVFFVYFFPSFILFSLVIYYFVSSLLLHAQVFDQLFEHFGGGGCYGLSLSISIMYLEYACTFLFSKILLSWDGVKYSFPHSILFRRHPR
ncbi:uncharacterized protein VP01_6721g1 [Puccinia sorghi]|uniref:Uncharacterized protein n=1 Tax=Puccinia sorghi TaxID=27349 RepID=A0A0L6UFK6_9BASI|nr:uncharacterized protein VP01_6721g1 [Puccinia sorghi]